MCVCIHAVVLLPACLTDLLLLLLLRLLLLLLPQQALNYLKGSEVLPDLLLLVGMA